MCRDTNRVKTAKRCRLKTVRNTFTLLIHKKKILANWKPLYQPQYLHKNEKYRYLLVLVFNTESLKYVKLIIYNSTSAFVQMNPRRYHKISSFFRKYQSKQENGKVPFPVPFLSSDLKCGNGLNAQNTHTHTLMWTCVKNCANECRKLHMHSVFRKQWKCLTISDLHPLIVLFIFKLCFVSSNSSLKDTLKSDATVMPRRVVVNAVYTVHFPNWLLNFGLLQQTTTIWHSLIVPAKCLFEYLNFIKHKLTKLIIQKQLYFSLFYHTE